MIQNLLDHKTGDTFSFSILYDEIFPFREVRGKDILFHVKILEVLKEVPVTSISDELIQTVFSYENLSQYIESIENNINKKQVLQQRASDLIMDTWIKEFSFTLPSHISEKILKNKILQSLKDMSKGRSLAQENMEGIVNVIVERMDDEKKEKEIRKELDRIFFIIFSSIFIETRVPSKDYDLHTMSSEMKLDVIYATIQEHVSMKESGWTFLFPK